MEELDVSLSKALAHPIREISARHARELRLLVASTLPVGYPDAFFQLVVTSLKDVSRGFFDAFDRLLGAVVCRWEDSVEAEHSGEKILYICIICVAPQYREQGVGSALLDSVELIARKENASRMRLHVQVSNEAALAFYKKRGFYVFFVGGVTYAEVAALRLLAVQNSFRILIAATNIVHRETYLKCLTDVE